ncbi:hypothetical protein RFI_00576 [Reticulomyxa filosa]|uniref:Uncharacterized protein n=1 Tax=Reticulomyxa filosa TaxID=46433 RepID=X6PEM1_RETFI|nr:hypothetical protein RFI_00576 [Reticulomyxa filosa]|eukprot:ETO36484.1 hypothetical protein RFI_00576 [Reticulomyxa filosa]
MEVVSQSLPSLCQMNVDHKCCLRPNMSSLSHPSDTRPCLCMQTKVSIPSSMSTFPLYKQHNIDLRVISNADRIAVRKQEKEEDDADDNNGDDGNDDDGSTPIPMQSNVPKCRVISGAQQGIRHKMRDLDEWKITSEVNKIEQTELSKRANKSHLLASSLPTTPSNKCIHDNVSTKDASFDHRYKYTVQKWTNKCDIAKTEGQRFILPNDLVNELALFTTISPTPIWNKNRFKLHVQQLEADGREYTICANVCRLLRDSLPLKHADASFQVVKIFKLSWAQRIMSFGDINVMVYVGRGTTSNGGNIAQQLFRDVHTLFKNLKNGQVPLFFRLKNGFDMCLLCIVDTFYLQRHQQGQCYIPREFCIPAYLIKQTQDFRTTEHL